MTENPRTRCDGCGNLLSGEWSLCNHTGQSFHGVECARRWLVSHPEAAEFAKAIADYVRTNEQR